MARYVNIYIYAINIDIRIIFQRNPGRIRKAKFLVRIWGDSLDNTQRNSAFVDKSMQKLAIW